MRFLLYLQANELTRHSVMDTGWRLPGQVSFMFAICCFCPPSSMGVMQSSPGGSCTGGVFVSQLRNFELRKPFKGSASKAVQEGDTLSPKAVPYTTIKDGLGQSRVPLLTRWAETCNTHRKLPLKAAIQNI